MRKFLPNLIKSKVKSQLNKFFKTHSLFLILLVFAAILRFYRLPEMTYFDFDQEYAAEFAHSVVKEFPIRLIGQGLSVQGLFMGPLYFYYLAPFFAIFSLHPLGGAVGSVLLGLVIIGAYYYFAGKLLGKPAGLIAAILRSILFSKLEADWSVVPSYSSELLVLITWYCFYQYWQGETRYLPLLGFVFGFYSSFHPILFPFYFVFLILLCLKRKLPSFKGFFLSLSCFLIPWAPLLLFTFLHNFMEVKRFLELFRTSGSGLTVFSLEKFYKYLTWMFTGPLGFEQKPSQFISLLVIVLMIVFTLKKISVWKESFHALTLCLSLAIFVVYYYFLPVNLSEYYFLGPISLLFFYLSGILGYLITKPLLKGGVMIFLVYVIFLNFKTLYLSKWSSPSLVTLAHKDKIVKEIIDKHKPGDDFFVSYIKSPGWDFGFSYLFKFYGYTPHDKPVRDATYTIVIPKSLSPDSIDVSSGNVGLILPDE